MLTGTGKFFAQKHLINFEATTANLQVFLKVLICQLATKQFIELHGMTNEGKNFFVAAKTGPHRWSNIEGGVNEHSNCLRLLHSSLCLTIAKKNLISTPSEFPSSSKYFN